MKVALLTNVFFPVVNGVVHSIHLLSKGLVKHGLKVSVVSSKHPKFNFELLSKYQINYNLIKLNSIYFPKVDYCIPNPLTLKQEVKKIDVEPNIIQINHPFIIFKMAKMLKKYNENSKVVFIYHTQYEQYYHYFKLMPKFLYERFLYNHLKEVFSFVDAVIFPSLSIKKSVEEKFDKFSRKFIFISNPVDLDHIENYSEKKVIELRKKYNLEGCFVLGFVGRLEKEKNLYRLIEFFREFLDFFRLSNPDGKVKLILVGGGSEYNNLVKYVELLNIMDYFVFTDKVPYDEIPNYFRLIDVFVSFSLTEVKPLSYLESLSAKVPIISFKTFGADDLIIDGYNGYLIEYNDNYKKNFIHTIYELYKSKELLSTLKENAYNSSKNYHYLNISKKYMDVYYDLTRELRNPVFK